MLLEIKCKNCGCKKLSIYPRSETIIIRCDGCFERPEFTVKTQFRPERISTGANEETPGNSETKEISGGKADLISEKRKRGRPPSGNAKSSAERTAAYRLRKKNQLINITTEAWQEREIEQE